MKRGTWIPATLIVVTAAFGIAAAQDRIGAGGPYRLNRNSGGPLEYYSRGRSGKKPLEERVPVVEDRVQPREAGSRSFKLQNAARGSKLQETTPPWGSGHASGESVRIRTEILKAGAFSGGGADPFPGEGRTEGTVHAHYKHQPGSKESKNLRNADLKREIAPRRRGGIVELKPPVPEIGSDSQDSFILPAGYTKPRDHGLKAGGVPFGPQTPTVSVKWVPKGDINVGQECECELVVTNAGTVEARDVAVEVAFPESVRPVAAKPRPAELQKRALWKFASLGPGKKQAITIRFIPGRSGPLTATASVRFTGMAAERFNVKEPMLKLALSGPTKVMLGDAASQYVEVTNPGTGIAKDVSIEAWIPAGLEHPRGERLMMDIGALGPGETRKVRLSLAATAGGVQKLRVKATSEAAAPQTAERVVTVLAPSLKVAVDGPALRYVGRNAVYTIKVSNDGSVPSNNVRVLHRLPDGFKFIRADKGGTYDAGKRTIGWFVGRVEPGKTREVKSLLAATQLGKQTHRAGAISEQGTRSQADFVTEVDGTASLTVEIFNPDNPVEVGAATVYEVRVRNTGTKADGNVELACDLPAGVELVGARGPTRSVAGKGSVVFSPLKSLPAGKTAVYRVQVRGKVAGNHRFRARLRSDSVKKPLTFDELTKFYAD